MATWTLWPLFKYIQNQFGILSSYTWNSPINSLFDFPLQMFGALARERLTEHSAVLCRVSRTRRAGASSGGHCSETWSFKVTAASQMSRNLHEGKPSRAKARFNRFIPAPNTYSRIHLTAELSKVLTFRLLRTKVPIKRVKRIQQAVFSNDASVKIMQLMLQPNVKMQFRVTPGCRGDFWKHCCDTKMNAKCLRLL